jgi:hypothetical protein
LYRYGFVGLLIAIALMAPYTVSRYLAFIMGPWSGSARQHDGTTSYMTFDVTMKPPAWLTLPPNALVASSTRTSLSNSRDTHGSLQCVAPMGLPALKDFFTRSLSAQGFTVVDEGLGPLDAKTATILGVSGNMSARRAKTGETVNIKFREEEGFFRKAQQMQIYWKIPG